MEKIEIPPGLIRTWKAFVICALGNIAFFFAGGWAGHSTARVETKEVRVEVPPPSLCLDEMVRLQKSEDRTHISCSHPGQHGVYQNVNFGDYDHGHYLLCTCDEKSRLDFDASAR